MSEKAASIEIKAVKTINYVTYQAYLLQKEATHASEFNPFSFLKSILLTNLGEEDLLDLTLKFDVVPEFMHISNIHLASLEKGKRGTLVNRFEIFLDPLKLYSLTEAMPGSIRVSLISKEGEILGVNSVNIRFDPIEASASEERSEQILASFVTPNDEKIQEIISMAGEYKLENFKNDSFDEYQSHDPNEVLKDVASVYETLNRCNIRYITSPASFDKIFQRVTLPRNVLNNRYGTCLDTSLLFASVFEAIGLRPVIIFLAGHALVGVWLDEESFPNTVEENSQVVLNNISKGFEHLCVIETTAITRTDKVSFQDAKIEAERTLSSSRFNFALDIERCRNELFWPIPSIKEGENDEKKIIVPSLKDRNANEYSEVDVLAKRYLPEEARKNKSRYDYWEDKLLDLNLSNKLLNFKCKDSTLQVMINDAEEFIDFLANNNRMYLAEVEPSYPLEGKGLVSFEEVVNSAIIGDAYKKKQILVYSRVGTKNEGPKKLSRKANTSLEESGCSPLFISIGLIRWFDNEISASHFKGEMYAPLFLLPVRIPRRKNGTYYTLDYDIDDLTFNQTLFEYFKSNFGLDFSSLNSIPKKENGKPDIRIIFNEVRKIITPMKNWLLLENNSTLSLFSFSHFVMWSDLKYNREKFMQNEIVSAFANGERYFILNENEKKDIKEIKNNDVIMPLSADSSQIKAIYDAEKGESFILDGPPGTGKSQTISNMIVNFLYHGKKVLFVAEKEVALDVVKRRLDDLNLGQFVLELANIQEPKSQVLDTYKNLLSLGGPLAPAENFDELNFKIEEKQNELNSKVASLHDKKDYIFSPYQAILIYLKNEDMGDSYRFSDEYLKGMSLDKYERAKVLLSEISSTCLSFDTYYSSPFLPFQKREYSMEYRDELKKELENLLPLLEDLKLDLHNVINPSKSLEQTKKNAALYFKTLALLREGDISWHECLLDSSFIEKENDIRSALSILLDIAKEKDKILASFSKEFLGKSGKTLKSQLTSVQAKGGLSHLFAFSSFKKQFKDIALSKEALKEDNLESSINSLVNIQNLRAEFDKCDPYVKYVLKNHSFETYPDGEETIKEFETTILLAKAINALDYLPNKQKDDFVSYLLDISQATLFSSASNKFIEHYSTFLKKKECLFDKYSFNLDLYPDGKTYFGVIYSKIRSAIGRSGNLAEWTTLLLKIDEAKSLVSNEYFSLFEDGQIKEDKLLGNYEKSVSSSIINKRFALEQLALLSGKEMDNLVNKYARDIKEFSNLSTVMTASKISSSYPTDAIHFAESTTYNQLAKLARNGGRGVSLRQIFHNYKDIIQCLTPCFMMSPTSVSQFLDINDYQFDVVIFDEASQIPTSEAIPSIARAKSVIIAGDEQQMPPTSFFTSTIGSNEGDSFSSLDEDLESLLDDAIVLGLPRKRLLWHYRSRHEALISFSNNKFYENSLLTFPSPKNDIYAISYKEVKGTYERGRGVNRQEAKEVVNEVIYRLKDKELRTHSIGIITFNEAQQNVIEDLLEKEMSKNSLSNIEPGGEKIFVKNLENVQGDERDVILFSTTYGPDKNGTFSMNFGPLSLKKGERRLNVAISRSREEMVVFSSMKPEDIKAEKAKNNGAQCLKDFLLFAKNGYDYLPHNSLSSSIKEKGIEVYLANDLRKLGYEVKENIGESTFKIDLGVALKEAPTEYLVGIILDNEQFANMTCRDRHLNEPSILSRLGWNIINVYSNEYLDHRQEVVQGIVKKINEILNGEEPQEKGTESTRKPLFVKQVIRKNSIPYTLSEEKYEKGNIISYLYSLIYFEGPISIELINRRYCEASGKKRVGITSKKEIEMALIALGIKTTHFMNDSNAFYVSKDFNEANFVNYRLDDENKSRRTLTDICYQEIANCAADILKEQGEMDIADLAKQISLVFGFKTLLASKNVYIQKAIKDSSCKRNRIRVRENRVSLAE